VRIVPRIADDCDTVYISLQVSSLRAEQELRRIVTLVEEWMTGRSVTVQAFKIELRAARIEQFPRIRMGSQDGTVSRNIVSYKLAQNGPASCGVTQGIGRIIDVSAIADPPCATQRAQKLFIRLK